MPEAVNEGVRIHYEVDGDGPPLVLHTGGGGDLRMWRIAGYVDGLFGYRCVLIDHRGHGRSDRPTGVREHTIDRYEGDVLAVMDELGVERFSFFGYSDGATLGYRLSATHPDRVAALIGLGAVGAPDESPDARRVWADEIRRDGIEALVRGLLEDEPDLPEWFVDQMRSTDAEMFALELEGRADHSLWDDLPLIEASTLIIVGELEEGDTRAAAANAHLAAKTLADGGRAVVLPELGHCAAFVRSDLVVPQVRRFLEG